MLVVVMRTSKRMKSSHLGISYQVFTEVFYQREEDVHKLFTAHCLVLICLKRGSLILCFMDRFLSKQ